MEAWKVVLPEAWLSNKQLALAPGPDSLFWTLEGNAYFASAPLMLCRNSALMRFVWLQTRGTESSLELSDFFFFPVWDAELICYSNFIS